MKSRLWFPRNARAVMVVFVAASLVGLSAGQRSNPVTVDEDDIGGVVTGPDGPEAGVWVIAETTDLPTRFSKIVVTDDEGRYLIPDLPDATYDVWVRGYGLVDSAKRWLMPGTRQDLTAVVAPDARAAAEYYPAAHWFWLIQVPDMSEFPGTGPEGNGISPAIGSQAEWIRSLKSGDCTICHALGTRRLGKSLRSWASSTRSWLRGIAGFSRGRPARA